MEQELKKEDKTIESFCNSLAQTVIDGFVSEDKGWETFRSIRLFESPPRSLKDYYADYQNLLRLKRERGNEEIPLKEILISGNQEKIKQNELQQLLRDNARTIAQHFSDPIIETQWIIQDLIPSRGIGSIIAREKSYKSYLSLYLACTIANGGKAFGKYEVKERCKVLVVDKENNVYLINERAKQLLGGSTAENVIHINACRIPLFLDEQGNGAKALLAFAKEHGVKVIILDSLYHFNLGDESNAKDISIIARQLIELVNEGEGLVCLYLHHKAKNKDTFDSKGSVNLEALVDFRLSIKTGTDENNVPIIIFNEMYRRKKPAEDWYVKIISNEQGLDFVYGGDWKMEMSSKKSKTPKMDDDEIKSKIYEILEINDSPMMGTNNIFNELVHQNITKDKPRFLILIAQMEKDELLRSKIEGQKIYYWINKNGKEIDGKGLF